MTNVAEDALRAFCSPSLVKEYESSSPEAKKNLLAGLSSSQTNSLMHAIQSKVERSIEYADLPKANESCPLVKALRASGAKSDVLFEEGVQYCRHMMFQWGIENQSTPTPVKLRHYAQICARAKAGPSYAESYNNAGNMVTTIRDVYKPSGHSQNRKSWVDMKRLSIRDLKLFDTSWGGYLEGTIVGEAIQPIVGGTTMIQDDRGDVLMVCFYNFLPNGIRGAGAEPILKAKFPQGAKIKIAEPFYKIFGDGSRGIRVDNPSDIEVFPKIGGSAVEMSEEDMLSAKKQGNTFVAKKNYDAALDIFMTAMRSTSLIPMLLSNRAQSYIFLEQWAQGLCDAAASLVIRPECQKTWKRYNICLEKVTQSTEGDTSCKVRETRNIMKALLGSLKAPQVDNQCPPEHDANRADGLNSKEAGNKAFQAKDFPRAIDEYSNGLSVAGGTLQALLNNASLCSLNIGALNDCIAMAAASLRIKYNVKATYRLAKALALLGERDLARTCINQHDDAVPSELTNLEKQICEVEDFMYCTSLEAGPAEKLPNLLSSWIGPVETFLSEGKGRGLRATRNLNAFEIILIEKSAITMEFDETKDEGVRTVSKGKVDQTSKSLLTETLINRSQHDVVLGKILNQLTDGSRDNELVPATALLRSIVSCRPLLLGRKEHWDRQEVNTPGAEKIAKIVDINVHGSTDKTKDSTDLFPCVSLLNHSNTPNATFAEKHKGDLTIVMVVCDVVKGEEIFMQYHEDEHVLKTSWGIR